MSIIGNYSNISYKHGRQPGTGPTCSCVVSRRTELKELIKNLKDSDDL